VIFFPVGLVAEVALQLGLVEKLSLVALVAAAALWAAVPWVVLVFLAVTVVLVLTMEVPDLVRSLAAAVAAQRTELQEAAATALFG
jgi:hypothetical protein